MEEEEVWVTELRENYKTGEVRGKREEELDKNREKWMACMDDKNYLFLLLFLFFFFFFNCRLSLRELWLVKDRFGFFFVRKFSEIGSC